MIWFELVLIGGLYLFTLLVAVMLHSILDELRNLPTTFPKFPDCQFKPSCLYSPVAEPERICALREEEKKNKEVGTFVQPAPRWIDTPP